MKKILLLLALVLVPPTVSAASFEGKVTMKMTGPKGTSPNLMFSLKEGLSRIDMMGPDGRNAGVILDPARQEMTILMPDQKMYMTRPIPKPAATTSAGGGITDSSTGAALEVTTVKEKILGYDCVKYVSQTKDGATELWVTDQLGTFTGFGSGGLGGGRGGPRGGGTSPQGWEQALAGKNVFPLRVITTSTGKETFRLEATAVEPQVLPASLFVAPADFKNLSEMMRGMGMPGNMPGGAIPPGGE